MKRTTVMLADDVLARLRQEARRRGISVAELVREAVDGHVSEPQEPRALTFFAAGEGGPSDASEHVDKHVGAALRTRALRHD